MYDAAGERLRASRPADRARRAGPPHRRRPGHTSADPRPASARRVRRRSHPGRHPSRSLGREPRRHRSGAAQGLHVDDRARARDPRRPRRRARRRLRRAVRRARGARVLVSRVLRTSLGAAPRRRVQRVVGGVAPDDARQRAGTGDRVDRRPRRAHAGDVARGPRRHPPRRCGDRGRAQRGRAQGNHRPRPARRRHPRRGACRMDAQPRAGRRLQACRRAEGHVRAGGRYARSRSHHLLPGRLPRRALVPRAAPARLPARAKLCRLLEGMGRPNRSVRYATP